MPHKLLSILCTLGVASNVLNTLVPQDYAQILNFVNALANTITLIVAGIIAYFIKAGIAAVNARLARLEKGQKRTNFRLRKLEEKVQSNEHV